jgi:serine/threonine protein kinase
MAIDAKDDEQWDKTLPDTGPAAAKREEDRTHETVRSERAGGPSPRDLARGELKKDFPELITIDTDYYVVTGELAHGGMGRILSARDRRLGRPVAIKELLVGSRNAGVRARFERETRITARLQHPGIINVIEAGIWPDGEPFFAMKLVEGESLDQAVGRCTTSAERMALLSHVIAAVDAMAYAHDRGIIHRDLKPQNILVGKFGETVVIDWGLAKELSDGEAHQESLPHRPRQVSADGTLDGEVMGTPAFMPREQALGEQVDARADVYALGAILYYVLTGRPPFEARNVAALHNAVIAESPPPLGKLVGGLPEDLQTIVGKAMAVDAADRYPGAGALATDLKHFQTGQLVSSHRYSQWQRLLRFVRRHRAAVAITVVSLILFVTSGTMAVRRIVREQHKAERDRGAALSSRADAEALLDFMLFDLRDKLRPVGKLDLLGAVAQRAVDYYAKRPTTPDDAADQRRRARALGNLGSVLVSLGNLPAATSQLRAELAIFGELRATGELTTADWRSLILGHQMLSSAFFSQGDTAQSLAEAQLALALQRDHTDDSSGSQMDLARAYRIVASARRGRGELARSITDFRSAQLVAERGFLQDPLLAGWPDEIMLIHVQLGDALASSGDLKGALEAHRLALQIAQQAAEGRPEDFNAQRDVAVGHRNVATVLKAMGDLVGALAEFRAALIINERLAERDPDNAKWQADLVLTHQHLSSLLATKGDLDGALAEIRAALVINERLSAADPTNAAQTRTVMVDYSSLANLLEAGGRHAEAVTAQRRMLELGQQLLDQDPRSLPRQDDVILGNSALATLLVQEGDLDGAARHDREAIVLAERRSAQAPADLSGQRGLLVSHGNYGELLHARGDAAGALAELELSLGIADKIAAAAPDSVDAKGDVIECHKAIAEALLAQGHRDQALEHYRTALAIAEQLAAVAPGSRELGALVDELRHAVDTCCQHR